MAQAPRDSAGILEQLGKILRSETFRNIRHQRNLLRLVVTATVEGKENELKGASIASQLFGGKDERMRVEAGKLRDKLLKYYQYEGTSDAIRIDVPVGGYTPMFSYEKEPTSPLTIDGTSEAPEQEVAGDQELPQAPLGSAGPLWHLPCARNPLFMGREAQLQSLYDESKEKNKRRVVQVLAALPGLGKTSIAVEYAYRFRKDYALVWWLNASTESVLLKDYEILARSLDTRYGKQGLGAIHHISDRLSALSDWLLIFDDVSSADDLGQNLPTTGTGHIIITSPDRNWKGTATICDVGPLDPPAAIAFLDDRLAGMPASFGKELMPELAADLSYIPAALDIASTYLELTCCPIESYLQRLRMLRGKRFLLFGAEGSAELVVARTWDVTLVRAQCESPVIFNLLRLFAWLDDCEIPSDFIDYLGPGDEVIWGKLSTRIVVRLFVWCYRRSLAPPIPSLPSLRASAHEHTLNKALATLQRYSIVRQSGSAFVVPPLIKVIMRTRQPKSRQEFWLRRALGFTAMLAWDAINRNDAESSALWVRHLRSVIQHSATLGIAEDVEDIRKARLNLDALEDQLTNPRSPRPVQTEPAVPQRLSIRDKYLIAKEVAKDLLPTYWALLGAVICWALFSLSLLGELLLYLYVHSYRVFFGHGLLWLSRICVVMGFLSGLGMVVLFLVHLWLKGKAPTSSVQDE